MKLTTKLAALTITAIFGLSMAALAEDGGSLYAAKCAMCHGADGHGKPHMGAALNTSKKSQVEVVALLTNGGGEKSPHVKPFSSVTADQASLIAKFVKGLK